MAINISILLENIPRQTVTKQSKKVLVEMYAVEASYVEIPMKRTGVERNVDP